MHEIMTFMDGNGIWVMVIAVVGIGSYFKFRQRELQEIGRAHV